MAIHLHWVVDQTLIHSKLHIVFVLNLNPGTLLVPATDCDNTSH